MIDWDSLPSCSGMSPGRMHQVAVIPVSTADTPAVRPYAEMDVAAGTAATFSTSTTAFDVEVTNTAATPTLTLQKSFQSEYLTIDGGQVRPRHPMLPYSAEVGIDVAVGVEVVRASSWFTHQVGPVTVAATAFVPGTLAHHIKDQITGLLYSQPATADKYAVWATNNRNATSLNASRNPNNPLTAAMDLSPFSAAVEGRGESFPGTLVTPRHVIMAKHVTPVGNQASGHNADVATPKWIAFLGQDGQPYAARIIRTADVPDLVDTVVLYLDQDIPAAVTPVSILPVDYADYLPHLRTLWYDIVTDAQTQQPRWDARSGAYLSVDGRDEPSLPCLTRLCMAGKGERIVTSHWSGVLQASRLGGAGGSQWHQSIRGSTAAGTHPWVDGAVGGDSGSQLFVPISGQTVLLTSYYTPLSGGCMAGMASILNPVLNAVKAAGDSTTYVMREANLSGFTRFA